MGAVDKLISDANGKQLPAFNAAVLADIGRMMEHNESCIGKRISETKAREALLQDHGVSVGTSKFLRCVAIAFGRSWGGNK